MQLNRSDIDQFLTKNNIHLSQQDQSLLNSAIQGKLIHNENKEESDLLNSNRNKPGDFNFKINQLKPTYDSDQTKQEVTFNNVLDKELQEQYQHKLQNIDTQTFSQKQIVLNQYQQQLNERRRTFQLENEQLINRQQLQQMQKQELIKAKQRFGKFAVDNTQKKNNYLQQLESEYVDEQQLREEEDQIQLLQKCLTLRERLLKRQINDLEKYNIFLQNVSKLQDELNNPDNIRKRYENLHTTKDQLKTKLNEISDLLEGQKRVQDRFGQECEGEVLKIQKETRSMEEQLAAKEQNNSGLSNQQQNLINAANKTSINYSAILLGINNLYARTADISQRDVSFEGMGKNTDETLQKKIKIISEVISDLQRIKYEFVDVKKHKSHQK